MRVSLYVRGIFLLLIIILCCGCNTTKKKHKPEDTILDESTINWASVYEREIMIAKENNDLEAWTFFWSEYIKELKKKQ